MTLNLTGALIYIDEKGNLLDKARLLHILMGEPPPAEAVQPLLDKQNPDGGFPSRPRGENASSVDNTITALWQMNEVGMLHSDPARRGLEFLAASQAADGSWDENPALPRHDLPPWIVPGETATRLYLTAYAAYWFAEAGQAAAPAFRRAVDHLIASQQEDGSLPSYLHANWIAASAFLMAGETAAAIRILDHLAVRQWYEWEDSQIAWALDCLGSAGLPADHPFVAPALADLAARQDEDGSWASEDGPAYAVSATVSALKVFKMYGLVEY
jgi:squalene cyclase